MKKITVGIIGTIVLAITAVLFLILGDGLFWRPVFWIGFCAVMTLEFITFALFLLCGAHPRRFAAVVVFAIATVATLVVSLFVNVAESVDYGKYILFLLVACTVAAVPAMILWSNTSVEEEEEAQKEKARAYFASCRNVVAALRHSSEGKRYDAVLKELEEDLRYADDTRFTELDEGIREQLSQLAAKMQDPAYDPVDDITDLKDLIKQRQYLLHG